VILALDGGLANLGYALVRPRTGAVLEIGTLTSKPTPGVADSTDRARRTLRQSGTLRGICERRAVTTLAAEAMSFGGPGRFAMAVSLCLFWGAIVTLAETLNLTLLEVTPKQWQHAILGKAGKVDYDTVFDMLSQYVTGQADTLNAIPKGLRNHALDAVGVGLYAALTPHPTAIRVVE
jgi:Holliday junction resolvasome RuvABC endonuclease subunit